MRNSHSICADITVDIFIFQSFSLSGVPLKLDRIGCDGRYACSEIPIGIRINLVDHV